MRIICCGTPYRGDDGAGLVVAERLHQLGIGVSTCTGEATDLLQAMNGAEEVLVVDAVITGAPAGTIHEWHDGTVEFQHNSSTSHALGVAEGIALARVLGRLPERIHLYSIEAKNFKVGGEVSADLNRAADELAQHIADLVSVRSLEIRGEP
jgi:hydrogenase maturation protease